MENERTQIEFCQIQSGNWWIDEPNHPQQRFADTNQITCSTFIMAITTMGCITGSVMKDWLQVPNVPPYSMTQGHYRACQTCQSWVKTNHPHLIGWEECESLQGLHNDCYTYRYDMYKRLLYPKYRYLEYIEQGAADKKQPCIKCSEWLQRVKTNLAKRDK